MPLLKEDFLEVLFNTQPFTKNTMTNTANIIDQYLKLKAAGIKESIIPAVIDAVFIISVPVKEPLMEPAALIDIPITKRPPATKPLTLRENIQKVVESYPAGKTFTSDDIYNALSSNYYGLKVVTIGQHLRYMQLKKVPGTPYKAVYLKQ